ncbi:Zinc finger protein [Armadillidium vulgare]|nr:Zinc finger protein [Armadillidium vulgare]
MAESELKRNFVENNLVFIKQEPIDEDESSQSSNFEVKMGNDTPSQNFQENSISRHNLKEVKLENLPCKQEPVSPPMTPQIPPKSVKVEEKTEDVCKKEPISPSTPSYSQKSEKESVASDSDGESDVSHEDDEMDSKFFVKLQTSKFPIVLVEKLNNLHCGIGYDAKLYEGSPIENNSNEKVMEKAFSQFIITVSKDEFKCSECGYIGRNKPHAIRHSLIHSDIKLYKCIDCHYESSRKDKYRNHLEKKHNAPFFECRMCEFATSRKHLMDKHNTSHQSQKINWRKKKRKRGRPFSSSNQKLLRTGRKKRKNLKVDLSEDRFSEITRIVDGIYVCAICNYKTKAKERAQRHSLIHTDMYYFCSECDSEFIGKDVYDAHIKDHHEKKTKYECKECSFIYDQKKEYENHLANHVKESSVVPTNNLEKIYSCSECDYKTRYQNHLVRHNRVHTSHKNPSSKRKLSKNSDPSKMSLYKYLDDFSDSVIEVAGHLYKCTLCPYVSTNKHHTRRHSLIHSETKLYKCTDCKFASNRKDKCKEHMRKIHPDKWKGGSTVFIRKSSTDSISECSSYDTEGSNGAPGSKKLYQCYECSFQTIFRSHLSKHQLRHLKRKDAADFDLLEDIVIKEELNFGEIDDFENESNINEITDSEENKMPLSLGNNAKTGFDIEDIKTEPTELFMVGHIKTEPSEYLVVEDGLVDPFLGDNGTVLENITDSTSSVVDSQVSPSEDKLLQCLDCNFTTIN